jgi:hypothetical protein
LLVRLKDGKSKRETPELHPAMANAKHAAAATPPAVRP